jgi:hypothetical protein
MHPDKQKNILNLSPQERYGYFIRKVADFEEVWLIQDKGKYLTLADKDEQIVIPVWPEKEFAELMLTDDWKDHEVQCMNLHDFIDWLDRLDEERVKIAGFPSFNFNGVVVTANEMKNHLVYESEQYE